MNRWRGDPSTHAAAQAKFRVESEGISRMTSLISWLDASIEENSKMRELPGNPVDVEQREGRVLRYLGHAVRKNVACRHGRDVLKPSVRDPWKALFSVALADVAANGEGSSAEFPPHWIYPGGHIIERRLLDHPLSREVPQADAGLSREVSADAGSGPAG